MDDAVAVEPLQGPGGGNAKQNDFFLRQPGLVDSVPDIATGHQLEHETRGNRNHAEAPDQPVLAAKLPEQGPFVGKPEALVVGEARLLDLEGDEITATGGSGTPDFSGSATGRQAADQGIPGDHHGPVRREGT